MTVLVVGGGGREHALAWKVSFSPRAARVLVAPGNAGTGAEPGIENAAVAADDIAGLIALARREAVDLTIVGPEAPLVAGIVDRFTDAGLRCFGPRAGAARLEGSKAFAKSFLARHGIPTADYRTFRDPGEAERYVRDRDAPLVVKADGLAAGKGVVVARSVGEAADAARAMLSEGRFGPAGSEVVIEDFLEGEEASFIAMVDGEHVLPLATSQDHKRLGDGDTGPNTGGMGAYSPAPVVTPAIHERVMREVIEPTVAGMAREGHRYTGFLYAGLMVAPDGTPRVLEFNCRLGDPEAQPVLMRLRADLVALCENALEGRLDAVGAAWDPRPAVGVVMASGGYPGRYVKGLPIRGLEADAPPGVKVFHAGTALREHQTVTAGGRVLCVCALGETVAAARDRAYERVAGITWEGALYRHDIAVRAIGRRPGKDCTE
ncbi:MAG TPA: phosphoribosylamine--glycine ligase [Gammaproteobacteria bacterium]|nr:phosphoribosylamine--glycine ligase [Gammaproteobacteria bacterium]